MTSPACTDDLSLSGEIVRTNSRHVPGVPLTSDRNPPAAYQCATKRFELRLTEDQRITWRAIAERQGVNLADLVRAAVALCADLPPGHLRAYLARVEADRVAGALADLGSFNITADEKTCEQPPTPTRAA